MRVQKPQNGGRWLVILECGHRIYMCRSDLFRYRRGDRPRRLKATLCPVCRGHVQEGHSAKDGLVAARLDAAGSGGRPTCNERRVLSAPGQHKDASLFNHPIKCHCLRCQITEGLVVRDLRSRPSHEIVLSPVGYRTLLKEEIYLPCHGMTVAGIPARINPDQKVAFSIRGDR